MTVMCDKNFASVIVGEAPDQLLSNLAVMKYEGYIGP